MPSVFEVKSDQRKIRLMALFLDGTGTAAISGLSALSCSLTDTGTGDYLITFDSAFASATSYHVLVTPTSGVDNIIAKVGTKAAGSVQILTENLSGTATDAECEVLIVGSDTADRI